MIPAPFGVILDANVIYDRVMRDILLRAAADGFYQARWSADILDEVERIFPRKQRPAGEGAAARRWLERLFPEADVAGYQWAIPALRNHIDDRHVVAAAVMSGAQLIVTFNLKDFVPLPAGMEAKSPDDFLCDLFSFEPLRFLDLLVEQAKDLQWPFEQLLGAIAKRAPAFVTEVEAYQRSRPAPPSSSVRQGNHPDAATAPTDEESEPSQRVAPLPRRRKSRPPN